MFHRNNKFNTEAVIGGAGGCFCIKLIVSISLFNHMLMRKFYALPRFDIKAARNFDKADSNIFQFNFIGFPFIVIDKLFYTNILYIRYPILKLRELFLSLLFRRYGVFQSYVYIVFKM